ncbi:glycine--tRNA ligase subunit beta [Hyphococcus sp.]|uniref:glycine--tRNA ligase subunit beta n=1 Tax=Hyphococcus sp. TaxID=2038636 RepID=UPI00208B3CB9|nr:MAG: hypothetical protein DHS20C04_16110 [Marinicaulis sp.]
MPDLLLELFSEEIPARMQARAASDLERAVNKALLDAGFMPEGVKAFSGPRRLTLVASGLPARQPDRREEKKGPRVGAPERAVEGFLKSAGLSSLDQCEQREDKKGAYWVAVIDQKGRDTADLIAEFVPEIVRGFAWPKSMRWGDGEMKWVRPLHSVLCTFDGEVAPFDIDGVAAGDVTQGHRIMSSGDIQARSFDAYASALSKAKVVLDAEERKEIIARDAATLCKAQGLELVEDQGLLNEVAGLAEWPVAMMGSFDEKFLKLPDEVLTASMRGHQKYFSVRDPKTGRLANKFIYVANLEAADGGKSMRTGYERVLTARLSDGWYLYNQDLKIPLADRIDALDKVTFFEGLGSVGDKARRIAALAKEIAPSVGADPAAAERAAMLAKADLVSAMVYEFPELQGVMGRYYYLAQHSSSPVYGGGGAEGDGGGEGAKTPSVTPDKSSVTAPLHAGEREALQIADAIRDHYKPAGQDDDVPTAPVSVAVALADKIDTLTAFWAIDKKSTGSSDPFALRRAALGVIELLLKTSASMKLKIVLEPVFSNLVSNDSFELALALQNMGKGTPEASVLDAYELITSRPWKVAFQHAGLLQHLNLKDAGPIDVLIDADIVGSDEFSILWDRVVSVAEVLYNFSGAKIFSKISPEIIGVVLKKENNKDDDPYGLVYEAVTSLSTNLLSFFHDRLKVYLRDKGHKHDQIDAVLTDADGNLQDDLVLIVAKLEALAAFLKTDDGANLAAAYKRAANILKAEEKKDKSAASDAIDEKLLKDAEEKALYVALKDAEAKAEKAVAEEDFAAAMSALSQLRAPLDAFFEKVTVNADDKDVRANRLALLARLRAATAKVADFSKLEG